jgi:hypothetical protein
MESHGQPPEFEGVKKVDTGVPGDDEAIPAIPDDEFENLESLVYGYDEVETQGTKSWHDVASQVFDVSGGSTTVIGIAAGAAVLLFGVGARLLFRRKARNKAGRRQDRKTTPQHGKNSKYDPTLCWFGTQWLRSSRMTIYSACVVLHTLRHSACPLLRYISCLRIYSTYMLYVYQAMLHAILHVVNMFWW